MKKGYVTVFFSLVITLCFSLFMGLIYGARENAIRLKASEAMEISIRSGFGEYQKDIWEKYNIVFVDAAYGYKVDSMVIPREHLLNCLNENFREEEFTLLGGKDLLKLSAVDVEIQKVRFATDNNGEAIRKQAVGCMKNRYGIEYLESLYDSVSDYENIVLEAKNYESYKDEAVPSEAKANPIIKEWVEKADEICPKEEDISLLSSLRLVIKDISSVSGKTVDEQTLLSAREKNVGNYQPGKEDSLIDGFYFTEYLLTYLGDYSNVLPDSALDYELEYLIAGKNVDSHNLESVVNRLLLTREAANMVSLYSDKERMEGIRAFSRAVSIFLLNPELAEPIEVLVVTVISSVESVKDVKTLLKGGRVPLMKESEDWDTTLENVFSKDEREESSEGLSYRDYLRIFISTQKKQKLTDRFMDILEQNVKKQTESGDFRLDFCYDAWTVTAYVQSEYGYCYQITRDYDLESE